MTKFDSLIDRWRTRFPRVDRVLTFPAGARASLIYNYGALAVFFSFYLYANYVRFFIAEPLTYGLGMLFKLSLSDLAAKFFTFHYYPPLYAAFCDLATHFVGYDYLRVLAVNNLLPLLTALYVFLLFRKMSDSALAPFAAGLYLISAERMYLTIPICIENLLTLTVAAYTYHLIASQRFLRRGHSLAAGAWAAAGLLTKWTFPVYVVGVTLLVGAALFYDFERRGFRAPKTPQWRNLGFAAGVVAGLAGWWYVMLTGAKYFFLTARNSPSFLEYSLPLNLWFYFHDTAYCYCPAVVNAAAFFAVFFWMFRRPRLDAAMLAAAIALPVFLLGLSIHIEDRYLYPLLPVWAFAAVFLAAEFRVRAVGLAAAGVMCQAALAAHFIIAVGTFNVASYPAQSAAILNVTFQRLKSSPESRPIHAALHPLWYNQHLRGEFYNYHLERHGLRDEFQLDFFIPEAHNLYYRGLMNGLYDIIYLDCGRDNDCLNARRDEVDRVIAESTTQPYVALHDGSSYGSFDDAQIRTGLEYLRRHYYEAASVAFGDGTYTRIYFHRRLAPPAAGAAKP